MHRLCWIWHVQGGAKIWQKKLSCCYTACSYLEPGAGIGSSSIYVASATTAAAWFDQAGLRRCCWPEWQQQSTSQGRQVAECCFTLNPVVKGCARADASEAFLIECAHGSEGDLLCVPQVPFFFQGRVGGPTLPVGRLSYHATNCSRVLKLAEVVIFECGCLIIAS